MCPVLIVISGLPGVGKTTLAAALADRIRAIHLSVDSVEEAMLGAGLEPGWTTGVAAYEAVRAAAEQNLRLGHTVVVDAVNDSAAARQTWREATSATLSVLRFVLLLPPPPPEHQRRLSQRRRGLSHVQDPTWEQVVARSQTYEEWTDSAIKLPASASLDSLLDRLGPFLAID